MPLPLRLAAVLVLTLAVSACSPGPLVRDAPETEVAEGYPNHSAAQIVAQIQASVSPVQAVKSDGAIQISSPSLNQDATFSLRSRLADSTTAVIRGPFGIIAARALLTPRDFTALDQLNRKLYEGPVSVAERYVPGAGSSERGARALFGLVAPESAVSWTVQAGNGRYLLTGVVAGGTRRTYGVDPGLWRVVSVRDQDVSGAVVGTQTFEAFDTVDGVVLPRRVVLQADDNRVVLEHRSLQPNPADLALRFSRPSSGYEVVRLD